MKKKKSTNQIENPKNIISVLVLLYKKLEGSTKTESQKAVTKQNDTS
jgi:hypothetical protein